MSDRSRWRMWHWIVWIGCGLRTLAAAQQPPTAEEDPPPPPVAVSVDTRDEVTLKGTYWPAPVGDTQTAPILLLHDQNGSRGDYSDLAPLLQRAGCAVLAVDLRGHGESTTQRGATRKLDARQLRPDDYARMARFDLEAWRRWLVEKNNARELNLSKLGIVASGMSATVAMVWAQNDWNVPPLATGKQGQDTQALVLLTPQWRAGTLRIESTLGDAQFQPQVSKLIAVGSSKRDKSTTDCQRLYDALSRHHPEGKEGPDLHLLSYPTTLQGAAMLGENLGLEEDVLKFFQNRLITPAATWTERKRIFDSP